MNFLYSVGVRGYSLLLHLIAPFHKKANLWVSGRKKQFAEWSNLEINEPVVWFHCASLGEYEQGKPVMENLKRAHPELKLLVTFFSPSGYENRYDDPLLDYVFYLPVEKPSNIKRFISVFKPKMAVFVKYEFWYGYMRGLVKANIPMFFISSTFRPDHDFFKWFGGWFLDQIRNVNHFFVQDQQSADLLIKEGINQVTVSGDTRFDRVTQTLKADEEIPFIPEFKGDSRIIIFGSAWEKEMAMALEYGKQIPDGWKMIFAPHELKESKFLKVEQLDLPSVRFTQLTKDNASNARILIVDTIGHLARLYKYGDVAMVGGGFIDGIHNILEPLTFGQPVLFGPNHKGFHEAEMAIQAGVGKQVNSVEEFMPTLQTLVGDTQQLDGLKAKSAAFVQENRGATEKISRFLIDQV